MSDIDYTKKILSKYVLKTLFSYLQLNKYYKIIKYNKNLQNRLSISNWKDSIFNYEHIIKTKKDIIESFEEMQNKKKYKYISDLSYTGKFVLKYSYYLAENINEEDEEIKFLIKYKGFKINDYPLPSNFNSLSFPEKMNIFRKNESYLKYSLSNENIQLINSINELREKNNMNLLIYNKLENLNTFFQEEKSRNEKHTFIYPKGKFKNKINKNNEDIIKILLKESFRYIIILEKELNEYIFLYSKSIGKSEIKENNKINNINKFRTFHLFNNTKPKIEIENLFLNSFYRGKTNLLNNIRIGICDNENGYQILSIINEILIGVLEGPPNTPYENGYFLFKILFPKEFPYPPVKFCFITSIFHPNISESGYVCADIFENKWSPALCHFPKLIYSVQSLLDDPNPDDFINEVAAKLYKKDRNLFNETVRYHTSKFANYSKFLEDLTNLNINYEIIKDEEQLKYKEKLDNLYKEKN